MGAPLRASVIIPTRNRRTMLMRTLESLNRQDVGPDEFEVVVVLDGTEDDSEASLRLHQPKHGLRWVSQPQAGLAGARNAGAKHAANEVFLFYDDDMEAGPGLVRAHLDAQRAHGEVIVQGYYPMAPTYLHGGAALAYDRSHRQAIAALEASPDAALGIWGGNISMRRDVFLRVGGFDPTNFRDYGAEDTDFGLRAAAAGVPVVLARDAIALHMRSCGYAGHRRQGFAEGRSLVAIERIHGRRMEAFNARGIGGAFDRFASTTWSIPPVADAVGRCLSALMWLADRGLPEAAQLSFARLVHRHYKIGGMRTADAR
jgi:glycosyltransferase involved in cell wall biosynthesis